MIHFMIEGCSENMSLFEVVTALSGRNFKLIIIEKLKDTAAFYTYYKSIKQWVINLSFLII